MRHAAGASSTERAVTDYIFHRKLARKKVEFVGPLKQTGKNHMAHNMASKAARLLTDDAGRRVLSKWLMDAMTKPAAHWPWKGDGEMPHIRDRRLAVAELGITHY